MKSPEWRWQRRRADLQHFEIFRHGPVIIYTRLPAGGTYYPICTFPASSESLVGISDAFSAFVYGYRSSSPRAHCTPNKSVPTLHYACRHGPIIYRSMPEGSYRVQSPGFPKIVYSYSDSSHIGSGGHLGVLLAPVLGRKLPFLRSLHSSRPAITPFQRTTLT